MVLLILRRRVLGITAAIPLLLLAAAVWLWPKGSAPASAAATPHEWPTLILDAGHGGADGGAVSESGVAESGINLAITRKLSGVLDFLGLPSVQTRTGEDSLADDSAMTLRQQKVSDTKNRVSLVNGYPNAVLLSIHQNYLSGYPTVQGAQVFYSGVSGGDALADHIQQVLNKTVNVSEKQSKRINDSIYLMRHAQCPAALVECGFLSNPEETLRLQEGGYQLQLAVAIAIGYVNFLHE